ncbi:MAG: hypothetical protein WCD35_10415 [Mycobacteriales bacterium]
MCSRHHTLIHRDGYQLHLHPDRSLTVSTADGTRLLHHPALPWARAEDLDPTGVIGSDTLPTGWKGERMDLDHVVWVLSQHAA